MIVDCGANAECTPEFLLQFGLVGSVYAKKQLGIENPKVGLLNIGTEDSKGTALQKEAYALLKNAGEKGLVNFVGNVEARDVPLGAVDVVVCDGFNGNVLLKTIEGTAMFMGSLMKKMFKKNLLSKLGYLLCASGVKDLMKMLDYREIGVPWHPQAGHQGPRRFRRAGVPQRSKAGGRCGRVGHHRGAGRKFTAAGC